MPGPAMIPGAVAIDIPTEGVMRRIARALSYVRNGQAAEWFGPGQPLAPMAPPEVSGRQFDFQNYRNIIVPPRSEEITTFEQLRALGDNCDILRLCVETRKDQLCKLPWTIRQKGTEEEITDLVTWWERPDQINDYETWMRMILEDMFVLDAPCVLARPAADGSIWGFQPIDGATINVKTDAWGRPPLTGTAYQQVLKGMPAVDYSREELIYFPRNPRTNRVYGYSQAEQVILTVNIAMRRQIHQLEYYRSGNTPDLLFRCPPDWTPKQVREFQDYFDAMLTGDLAERRRGRFIPGGVEPYDTKQIALTDKYDEWLARVVCYAFSLPPTPFVAQVNRATAETAQETAMQEGLLPLQQWWRRFMNRCLVRQGRQDSEFHWVEEDATNPLDQARIFQLALGGAAWMTTDEAREKTGLAGSMPPPPVLPAPSPLAGPSTEVPPELAEKLIKSRRLPPILRDRPALIKQERRWVAEITHRLHQIRQDVVPRLLGAYTSLTKADDDVIASKIRDLITEDDFRTIEQWFTEEGGKVFMLGATTAAGQIGNKHVTEMLSVVNERGVEWAKAHSAELITDILESTRNDVQNDIVMAMEEGWSNQRLAQELADSYGFSISRAETIARTETCMADIEGVMTLYRESGMIDEIEWLAADAGPCEICEGNEAAGPVKMGEAFPSGDMAPPAHPNCRCATTAVIKDTHEGLEV